MEEEKPQQRRRVDSKTQKRIFFLAIFTLFMFMFLYGIIYDHYFMLRILGVLGGMGLFFIVGTIISIAFVWLFYFLVRVYQIVTNRSAGQGGA